MMSLTVRVAPVLLAATLCLCGCGSQGSSTPPSPTPTPTPAPLTQAQLFKSVVFLGDSLTYGQQNGSMLDTESAHSYPAVLSAQGSFPITQALVAYPGYLPVEQLVSATFPYEYVRASGTTTGRENRTVQATNLGVPGTTAAELISQPPDLDANGNADDYISLVLGYPIGNTGSQLQQGIALAPSCVFLWIGTNDVLPGGSNGDPSSATPVATFSNEVQQILSTLQTQTSARIFIANLPDYSLLAAFMSGAQLSSNVGAYTGQPAATIMAQLGLAANDLVKPDGWLLVESELDSIKAGTAPAAIPDGDVLRAAQVLALQANITAYNQAIAQQAQSAGATVVDLYSFVNSLKTGMSINGTTLTLSYLGGFYSIDGLHLTNTGYALVANQFIAAVNSKFGFSIPAADISAIAAADPLFPPNIQVMVPAPAIR